MDSLADILSQKPAQEPEEVAIIKEFIREQFKATAGVAIQQHAIVISVRGAALAGALRPHLHTLQATCNTKKRLIIRIQ